MLPNLLCWGFGARVFFFATIQKADLKCTLEILKNFAQDFEIPSALHPKVEQFKVSLNNQRQPSSTSLID